VDKLGAPGAAAPQNCGVTGGAILIALVIPVMSIRLGEPTASALAQSGPAHVTLQQLGDGGVPAGVLSPIEILTTPAAAPGIADRLGMLPGVYTAIAPHTADYGAGATAIVDVLPIGEPSSPAGNATIGRVQHAAHTLPGVLGVGGAGPTQRDFIHAVYGSLPLMIAVISLLTFVLLTRAFRSIVLAAKAVLSNLLSVGAAYGVMVLVWQHGLGSHALWGIPTAGSITVWVPIMVFAFLFGLSMDYEVFILARMREEYDATGSTDHAVEAGIGRTGRLVTSAALILFLSFISMSTTPNTDVKVLATGLGAGILLDALIVRALLVPAMVGVLGRFNWWLPTWAARVLRVQPSPLVPLEPDHASQPAEIVLIARRRLDIAAPTVTGFASHWSRVFRQCSSSAVAATYRALGWASTVDSGLVPTHDYPVAPVDGPASVTVEKPMQRCREGRARRRKAKRDEGNR
jgi:RND superfamily putative drug exporter